MKNVIVTSNSVVRPVILLRMDRVLLLRAILVSLNQLVGRLISFTYAWRLSRLHRHVIVGVMVAFSLYHYNNTLAQIAQRHFMVHPIFFHLFRQGANALRRLDGN